MTRENLRVVIAEPYEPRAVERLREVAEVAFLTQSDRETLLAAVGDCDALLVRTYTRVDRAVLAAAPRLKVIGRGGVGVDNIDLEAAGERGITVVHTPAAATEAVADLTLGMMLALNRRIPAVDRAVREGRFDEGRNLRPGPEMSEMTVGIVGLGRIGRAVARRCRWGFGMRVLYNDIVPIGWTDFAATAASKTALFAASDIVTLHVPLDDSTRGMIDAAALNTFKPGACLVNTSRGEVVDPVALAGALESGHLAGAACDVFTPEPLPPGHALLAAPHTVFTPHIGARTARSQRGMNDVVEDVIRVLQGQPPRFPAWAPILAPGAAGH